MKALIFKAEIKELEDKIWRKVLVEDTSTLGDLIYLVLTSLELYSNEFFTITYKNKKYDSANKIYDTSEYKSVSGVKLKDLSLSTNDVLLLEYDLETKMTIIIKYLETKETSLESPQVLEGSGKGGIDYVSDEELKKVIEETDKNGYSTFVSSVIIDEDGNEEEEIYDYRDFDLEDNNTLSSINVKVTKEEYEKLSLIDILRITKEKNYFFYKTDIKAIVNPHDYIRKYIPKNLDKLSEEEQEKIHIPSYEELNIYELPNYKKIDHKEIMTSYIKNKVKDKEIRQALFYTLRNHNYLEKYYNNLRKYRLFKDFLDYSKDYYNMVLRNWEQEKNIKI